MARVSRWLLALGVAGSALAVGTVHAVTLCIVTIVLAVAAALAWWRAEPMRARGPATLLLFTGIGLTAYTALQCVPMPIGVLGIIAPHNADVWSRALSPMHEPGPRWAPITLDPIATRIEVLKGVAYLLAFVTALRVARRKEGVWFLSGAVILTGMALAAAALLHPAFGARRLFGVYDPGTSIVERHIAPLMNANNLAGYLTIAACLALAASLAPDPRLPRPVLAVVVLLLVATQVWVASRGGVITMVLGLLVVLAITRLARSERLRGAATISIVTGVVAAAGGVLVVLGGSEDAPVELFDRDLSKVEFIRHMMRMFPAVPFFGCGRGAFESAFAAFRTDVGYVTVAYPENVVVQWVLEWGLPVGLAGLVAMAFALRPTAVLARSFSSAGAWAGVLALAIQNLGDLGTETPGLVVAAVVCGAMVVAGAPGHRASLRVERWGSSAAIPVLATGVAVAAVAWVAAGIGGELHGDQRAAVDALRGGVALQPMHVFERAAMLRHPSEPYLPFAAAARAAKAGDESPIPWVGATLERASVYGPAHLVLARLLAERSRSQGRLEYRLALMQAPELLDSVAEEVPRLVASYDDAVEVVPEGKLGVQALDHLAALLDRRLPSTTARLDGDLKARAPTAPGPAYRGATRAVLDVEAQSGTPWCEDAGRATCIAMAMQQIKSYQLLVPNQCVGYELEARVRVASGDTRALADMASAADRVQDRVACLESLVGLADKTHDVVRADATLSIILSAGCSTESECAANLAWVANAEEVRGNRGTAKALYQRAYERAPEQDSLLANVARLAAAEGLHTEAAADYARLARSHPNEARWAQAAEQERAEAARSLLKK